jgi:hypothetical protein
MGVQVFKGRTVDAQSPFLSTEFWKKGVRVAGVIERVFKIEGRNNYAVHLLKPVEIDGEPCDVVSVGESAGLRMAMQAAKVHELREGDQVVLECEGETASKKKGNSPRKDFNIEVTRPEVEEGIPEYAR